MEAEALKKIPLYLTVAVILGLSLILIPLATIKAENGYNAIPESIQQRLKALEGTYDSGATTYSGYDVEILAISFAIALVAYLLFKHSSPRREHEWTKPYLF
jgi:branched-subunit amino acid ABC-type transport system permease component